MTEPEMTEPEMTGSPATEAEALDRAESDAAAEAAAAPLPVAPAPDSLDGTGGGEDALTSNDYTVAFSPRQLAVGMAIVAGLVAVLAARRRHRKRTDPDA